MLQLIDQEGRGDGPGLLACLLARSLSHLLVCCPLSSLWSSFVAAAAAAVLVVVVVVDAAAAASAAAAIGNDSEKKTKQRQSNLQSNEEISEFQNEDIFELREAVVGR
jgi:hypothetical protein